MLRFHSGMSGTSRIVWGRRLGDEFWSSVASPLTYSLLAEVMAEHMVRKPLREAGLSQLAEQPVFRCLRGRVYVNMSLAEEILFLVPRPLRVSGLLQLLPPQGRDRLQLAAGLPLAVAPAVFRLTWHDPRWLPWRHLPLFERSVARVEREFRESLPETSLAGASAGDLYRLLLQVRNPLGEYLEIVAWVVGFGYLVFQLTRELIERWAGGSHGLLWPDLVAGVGTGRSLAAARDVAALGSVCGKTPGLDCEAATDALAEQVRTNEALDKGLRRVLDRHGHRMSGRDLTMPSWRESPRIVLGLVQKSCLAGGLGGDPLLRREVAQGKLEAALPNPAKRRVLGFLLYHCRRYCALREEMRYVADYLLCRMRLLSLALGKILVSQGRLRQIDDVFYLELAELESTVAGDSAGRERARGRREEEKSLCQESPPEFASDESSPATERPEYGSILRGEMASPGKIRGRACLVRSASEIESIQPGDIVVARHTDPSWLVALAVAGALVVENAGQLSHGAIMARELGIPALVDVSGATSRLRTGDTVRLDADTGTLALVSESAH